MSGHLNPGKSYRIVMVAACPFPFPQGSQVLISQLSETLHGRGHHIDLVTYHWGTGEDPPGLPIRRVPGLPGMGPIMAGPSWRKPVLDMMLAERLVRTVRVQNADLIHTHNVEGLLAALITRRLTGVPVVYHVHNAMGPELHTYFSSRLGRWAGGVAGRWADVHLPRRADYCILLTGHAQGYFRKRGVERMAVVPPGIDFQSGQGASIRKTLGSGPLVIYSGNLDRYQDLDLLLDGFRLTLRSRPDALLVVSTNARPDKVRAHAMEKGIGPSTRFVQAGNFDQVRNLLAAADVAVCPRQVCLGFPIKILNYMAAGKAIVASEGSARGLRHGENGWVVPNDDAQSMAAGILTLLDNPGLAQRLGEGARQTALTKYNWNRACAAIEEVYAHTVRRRRV
jgi:glycosyltransferase involved in cell wall biosynthesis